MNLSKTILGRVARLLHAYGIRHVIISPGSRNAPLILALAGYPGIEAFSVPDERSAGYFGIGMAQQTGNPVVLVCTSGTAALNYAPAVAEAYYQKIPLLVFTADRPIGDVDRGDSQTIHQNNIYHNFINGEFIFPDTVNPGTEETDAMKIIHEAVTLSLSPEAGPVHINFPFSEPLYGFTPDYSSPVVPQSPEEKPPVLNPVESDVLLNDWDRAGKKMIITGQMLPGHGTDALLDQISRDPSVVVLTETTANLTPNNRYIDGIDKVVETILPEEAAAFSPDLVITLGGHVVSRKIKTFLTRAGAQAHWHVSPSGKGMDMFRCQKRVIPLPATDFLKVIVNGATSTDNGYRDRWTTRLMRSEQRMDSFMKKAPYSDLTVFASILDAVPGHAILHLGNSTPVRYHQLFRQQKIGLHIFGNRGVSGIDGTVSTAAGAAWVSGKTVYLVTGDMGFFYDANGLWHNYLGAQLKIVVINNGGGGIFRFIDGPDQSGFLPFFETPHHQSAENLAKLHRLSYRSAENADALKKQLVWLNHQNSPSLLEVFTPAQVNGEVLRSYFNTLKQPS